MHNFVSKKIVQKKGNQVHCIHKLIKNISPKTKQIKPKISKIQNQSKIHLMQILYNFNN